MFVIQYEGRSGSGQTVQWELKNLLKPLLQNLTKTVNWKIPKNMIKQKGAIRKRTKSSRRVKKTKKIKINVFSCHFYKIRQWLWAENPAKYDYTEHMYSVCYRVFNLSKWFMLVLQLYGLSTNIQFSYSFNKNKSLQ